jgi:hypothetical protein
MVILGKGRSWGGVRRKLTEKEDRKQHNILFG